MAVPGVSPLCPRARARVVSAVVEARRGGRPPGSPVASVGAPAPGPGHRPVGVVSRPRRSPHDRCSWTPMGRSRAATAATASTLSRSCPTPPRPRGCSNPKTSPMPPPPPRRAARRRRRETPAGRVSTRSAAADEPAAPRWHCARRVDLRGGGDRAAADDPARARPRFGLWLWRHPDRAGPGERARHTAKVPTDLRRRRSAVRARQRRVGIPGSAQLRREQLRDRQRPRHRRPVGQQLRRRGRADADRDRRRGHRQLVHHRRADPTQPARRHDATERVQRGRRRLRRRDPAGAPGRPRRLACRARRLEQLPARNRASHSARRPIHANRPRQRRRPGPARRRLRRSRPAGRGVFR